MRRTLTVLGAPIDVVTPAVAVQRIAAWAAAGESRVVCVCNAHSVVTASDDPSFMATLCAADMATADGASVAWMLRRLGAVGQERVSGPDLMLEYCAQAAARGESIYLYGSTPLTLATLEKRLTVNFPGLQIAGSWSPPFRAQTPEENSADMSRINASGARTVWVSLGCPKQEEWMAAHSKQVQAVMIGVGAAFDFHAGTLNRAPIWMQNNGLEWLHRLCSEPKRLWRRYLISNLTFVRRASAQLWRTRSHPNHSK